MVNVMIKSMLVPIEEVQLWHKAQREDPLVHEMIKRHERQKYARKEFKLTLQGLLY